MSDPQKALAAILAILLAFMVGIPVATLVAEYVNAGAAPAHPGEGEKP